MHYKNNKNYDRVSLEVHVLVARLRLQLKIAKAGNVAIHERITA